MSIVGMTGFDLGTSDEVYSPAGAFSIQNSVSHSGGYSLRVLTTTPTQTGKAGLVALDAAGSLNNAFNTNDLYVRFYFRCDLLPASGAEEFFNDYNFTAAKGVLSLRITSSGTIDLYDQTPTKVATGTTVLTTSTWYCIEVHFQKGVSGAYELRINAVTEYSGTCNQTVNTTDTIFFGKMVNRSSQQVTYYFDDVLVSDSAFPGIGQGAMLLPAANGTYQTFTVGAGVGSHYQLVNEIPPDGNTSYLISASSAGAETEAVQTRAQAGIAVKSVNAVRGVQVISNNAGDSAHFLTRLRSATTNLDMVSPGSGTASATYSSWYQIYNTNPATSATWLPGALDTLEVGSIQNGTNKGQLTHTSVYVDYIPATGSLYTGGCELNGLGSGGKFFTNPLG